MWEARVRGVVLAGFMGVGKSTVAGLLGRRLDLPVVDMDDHLVARFGPIPDQFARDGEAAFRQRERALLASLADGVPRVVSTGGGAWVDPRNRALARRIGLRVVLDAPLDWLRPRIQGDPGRPLADGQLAARYASRRRAYADADVVLPVAARSLDALVASVLELL